MNALQLIFIIVLLSVVVLPIVIYLCIKFGTYAFYKAKSLVRRDDQL